MVRTVSRRNFVYIGVLIAVLIVIGLIGLVTYSSSDLVNETVRDQFRSQELQFTSSLAVQAETYFNGLNADITSLALEPDIKNTAPTDRDEALLLLAEHAAGYPGIVRTIVRYDYQGTVRYAWPEDVNALVLGDDPFPFTLPADLVRQTQGGSRVSLDVEFRTASHRQLGDTFLLIAPVYTRLERTEFIVYELDIDALFNQVVAVVELDERGQLWIIDALHDVMHQANESVSIDALYDRIPPAAMLSFTSPVPLDYLHSGQERLAVVAPVSLRGEKFVLILSRDVADALDQVEADLQRIFALAVGAIVVIAILTMAVMRGFARAAQREQLEQQRRETARMLLEMSRALNSTLNLEDVLRSIMAELSNIVPYDSAAILLLDRAKLTLVAHRGTDAEEHQTTTFELDEAHAANQVLQTGRPLAIDDTHTDERWGEIDKTSQIRSWMGIPLRVREKTVGVLNINSHAIGRYKAEEIALAEAFADQASVALQNARLHEVEVKQIEQELTIARDIQSSLLPSAAPDVAQIEVAAHSAPARQVSGDYFQYLPMPSGQLGIAVGDVSGKGIPAALLMAVISTAMRDEIARNARPADLLNALNKRLLERMRTAHVNSALMVGIFDPPTRRLELANGGMVQPYVRASDAAKWEFIPVGGYPLGLSQRMAYTSKTLTLAPGSLLLIMSDGVVEAQNPSGEFYGFERLEELLNGLPAVVTAQGVIDALLDSVKTHLEGEEAQDDLTIMAIRSVDVEKARDDSASEAIKASVEVTQPAKPEALTALTGDAVPVENNLAITPTTASPVPAQTTPKAETNAAAGTDAVSAAESKPAEAGALAETPTTPETKISTSAPEPTADPATIAAEAAAPTVAVVGDPSSTNSAPDSKTSVAPKESTAESASSGSAAPDTNVETTPADGNSAASDTTKPASGSCEGKA